MNNGELPTKQDIAKAIVRVLREDTYRGVMSVRLPEYYGIPRDTLLPVLDWLEGLIVAPETKEIAESVKRIEAQLEKWTRQ